MASGIGAVVPACESQFDPVELIGTQIPFMDPFAFDDNDFRASYYTSSCAVAAPPLKSSQRKEI